MELRRPGSARHRRWSGAATPAHVRVAAVRSVPRLSLPLPSWIPLPQAQPDGVRRTSQRGAPPRAQPPVFRLPQICGPTETRHPARRTFRAPYLRPRYAARNQEAAQAVGGTVVRWGAGAVSTRGRQTGSGSTVVVWRSVSRQHGQRSNSSIRSLAVFPQQTRNHDSQCDHGGDGEGGNDDQYRMHSSPMK